MKDNLNLHSHRPTVSVHRTLGVTGKPHIWRNSQGITVMCMITTTTGDQINKNFLAYKAAALHWCHAANYAEYAGRRQTAKIDN